MGPFAERWAFRLAIAGALFALLFPMLPVSAPADEVAWRALARPGAVAIMRHALAPGTGDPEDFDLGDCTKQRNLSEAGRAQARAIGAALRARGIGFARVLTSQWCRCRETAELLGVGPVEEYPALNSFFRDRSTLEAQTEEVERLLAAKARGQRLLFVTHQVNITALTGAFPRSGEIIVMSPDSAGATSVLGSIEIAP